MSDFPAELRYTKEHEWARQEGDLLVVGITSHAVEQLGDITMVTLPEPGTALKAGDAFGDVDSVKAVSELYAPLDCEVVECNSGLEDAPESVNENPYTDGWMLKVRPASADAFAALMDAEAYTAFVGEG